MPSLLFYPSIHWVSDRCRGDFALWWFFVRKKMSSHYWQFFFLFGLYYQTFLEFSQIWKTELPFWVDNALFTCWGYLGMLNYWFQFFFCGIICFYVSISDVVFLVTSFSILITVSGWYYHFDVLSFVHSSNLIGLVVVALANLRWSVFVSIKLSQIGSFH